MFPAIAVCIPDKGSPLIVNVSVALDAVELPVSASIVENKFCVEPEELIVTDFPVLSVVSVVFVPATKVNTPFVEVVVTSVCPETLTVLKIF